MSSPLEDVEVIVVEAETAVPVITVSSPGPQGPPGIVAIGEVTSTADGEEPSITLGEGEGGLQVLDFVLPRGATGPAGSLAIGTVTTGAAGSSASATITGTSPNQTLNLTIPQGASAPGTASQITDSTAVGRSVLTAANAAAARTALSAAYGNGITEVRLITQAAYTALGSYSASTLYVIVG